MTRVRAEELLAEKGWWLEHDADAKQWRVRRQTPATYAAATGGYQETVATGSTWRMAVSEALGEPMF